jgi:hypothetical protein
MSPSRLLLALLLSSALAGCVHTTFAATTTAKVPARAPNCPLEMVFDGRPRHPYLVLGSVGTDATERTLWFTRSQGDGRAVERLMATACASGADGLMSIVVAGQNGWGLAPRWRTTEASAVAFVYVDASGRPLRQP